MPFGQKERFARRRGVRVCSLIRRKNPMTVNCAVQALLNLCIRIMRPRFALQLRDEVAGMKKVILLLLRTLVHLESPRQSRNPTRINANTTSRR
jgi:hypothetical protein